MNSYEMFIDHTIGPIHAYLTLHIQNTLMIKMSKVK